MKKPHFLVHNSQDSVGVAVVEDIKKGQTLTGWVMDTDKTISIKARDHIPIGHKLALKDMSKGATVIKYGHDIGRTIKPIKKGAHLHVHNTKTKRW
ncbi:MAG: UxaA family hydrolase [Gammaproteobacteria bacterium]|nr:UxaA family hydrolase [Gammaproteobacteria bacterium]